MACENCRKLELQKQECIRALRGLLDALDGLDPLTMELDAVANARDVLCKMGYGEYEDVDKRECDSTTGTRNQVHCVGDEGHHGPHSDGKLITWRD